MADQEFVQSAEVPLDAVQAVPFRLAVSVEPLLYAILLIVGLVLRLAELGTIVLTDREAHEALAVLRTMSETHPGSLPISAQPVVFAANSLLMTLFGTANAIPRLATVFAGLALILTPLLFRRWIGGTGAFLAAALFTLSPVLLAGSRSMSGVVWVMLFALVTVWSAARFAETRWRGYGIIGTVFAGLLLVGAEGQGVLVAIMLMVGLLFALSTADDPDRVLRTNVRAALAGWPWLPGLLVMALTLFAIGTVFFLKTEGLATFGEALGQLVRGLSVRQPNAPFAVPLSTALLYEPVLWIFGVVGAWLTLRDEATFFQRMMIGWVIAAVVIGVVYPGALPSHALWYTVPLVFLSAVAVERLFSPVRDQFFSVPAWGPYLYGIAVVATLSILGIRLLTVSRSVIAQLPTLVPPNDAVPPLLFSGLTVVLIVILFFLVGSIWGSKAAWRGLGIGLLVFLSMYSFSSGWRASVTGISDPREPFNIHPAARNLNLLERDLREISLRATGMPYDMQLTVAWADDSAVAWAIRNFDKAEFVSAVGATFNGPAVLLPRTAADPKAEQPKLGAAYVGKDYPVTYQFDRSSIAAWDVLGWVYQRDTRAAPTSGERIVLWVRADVYGASPGDATP